MAVCSTSNERAVQAIVDVMLGAEVAKKMRVFAGDVVPAKKPDPAIYLLAAQELGVDPARWFCCEFINERESKFWGRCTSSPAMWCLQAEARPAFLLAGRSWVWTQPGDFIASLSKERNQKSIG